ncbi:MAG: hypothetical protein QM451_12675 [Bacillota bacterium]|nr:hypothetical protein [Bacillota bacterium]HHT91574.1 hypothetical protein [Bacillota bacterium]
MKKFASCILVILLTLLICPARSGTAQEEVLLRLEGAVLESMTREEFLALEQIEVVLTRTNSRGKTTVGTYRGVRWSELAKAIGAEEAKSIRVVASDGFEQAYTLDVLKAPGSLFALSKDGEPITEEPQNGQIWFCASEDYTANYWTKFVAKIVVP